MRGLRGMSPLQFSVYWRLSLVFVFASFLFFLDIFTAAITAAACRHDNGTDLDASRGPLPPNAESNQSRPGERSGSEADWSSESGNRDSVCGWTDWLSYGQTLYMVGLLLGSLIGGAISDRYGKRPVLLVCVCVHALCGLVPAVLPQPLLFLVVRCLTGVCCCCINICSFSLAVEWTPPTARLWPPAFLPFCFSLGTMAGAPLGWLSPTWTHLHLSLALPQLVCLPLFLSIPESPRWLLLRRRTDVLDRYRGNSPADQQCLDLLLDSAWSDLQKSTEAQKEEAPGGQAPSDIMHLRHPTVLLRLFIMSYLRGSVSARPAGAPGPSANQHARSVPERGGLLPVVTAVQIPRSGPIIGCGLCLLLPETSGIPLPDSVEDCDRQPRPRPPNMDALWSRRKLGSSQTRKTEMTPAEKDDTHTQDRRAHTQSEA
ncbi:hypothetical protein INR49_022004 [Caranx melampygus]|nr:hypothetical protein INR49_022004 [Caranx melampygus]